MSETRAGRFALEVRDLHKTFHKGGRAIEVLDGLDLSLATGDMVSVMGRSGAGKSTLLHILGALERPTSGRLLVGDRDLAEMDDRELSAFRGDHVGFVFQFHHLLPEFTALENVVVPSFIAGLPDADARDRARHVLEEVGLADRMDHRPGELSGGEQQRVAIARALVRRPELVLADEPTGNLDRRNGRAVHDLLIDAVTQRGAILVLVTHDHELADLHPRRLSLEDGKLRSREVA